MTAPVAHGSKRVLYLLRYFPTLTETFVYREIVALQARGWEVAVGTLGGRSDGRLQEDPPSVPVLRPPNGLGWPLLLAGRLPRQFNARSRQVLAWLRRDRTLKHALKASWLADRAAGWPQVHVHFAGEAAEWALAAWRLHGVPFSVTVHAVDLFKPRPALPEVLAEARQVFTISRYNQECLERDYGVQAELLRCGVPSWEGPRPAADRQPLVVAAVGRWIPKKGLDLLVQAVESLDREVELLLVADAPESVSSARVHRLGLLPSSAVRAVLGRAGLLALPCRQAPDGDMDGVPVVLMEALSAGLPVLTTPVSGIPELVDEQVGWLAPPDDLQGLQYALRQAADSPEQRLLRGSRGPARLRERGFTLDDQVNSLCESWRAERKA